MKLKFAVVVLAVSVWAVPVHAAEKTTKKAPGVDISTGPISSAQLISPGKYVATVAPTLNGDMAAQLKKAFEALPGLSDVSASGTDSTLRFTVKEGTKLRVADLQSLVAKTDAGAVMTTPVLEHSMTPKPGF